MDKNSDLKTVYMVVASSTTTDSYNRDYEEFYIDEDSKSNLTYFITRESAQAWIDEQSGEGNAVYQKALAKYPAELNAYRVKRSRHNAEQNEIAKRAKEANVPYQQTLYPFVEPRQPKLSNYVEAQYQIWEINPHERNNVE